jgi:hypothetical protein
MCCLRQEKPLSGSLHTWELFLKLINQRAVGKGNSTRFCLPSEGLDLQAGSIRDLPLESGSGF